MGEADWLYRTRSAEVRIPSGHGGWEACLYMSLALGQWYLALLCVVPQGFQAGMVGGGEKCM